MLQRYVLGIDLGTSRTKAIIFDHVGNQIASGYRQIPQIYPKPGWLEQNPNVLWQKTIESVHEALRNGRVSPQEIDAIGIADQGETILMWDKQSGQPVYNAIVWQCRRTAKMCEELKSKGLEEKVAKKTGLVIDAYFSATKVKWILEHIKNVRDRAERGEVLCGTTDTWLIWKFTRGRSFFTDYATASRTMMFNIHTLRWDKEILEWLNIPRVTLPKPCSNSQVVGYTDPQVFYGEEVPIAGVIVDQQGALFGQACYEPGMVKSSYGTGCFILMNTGQRPVSSRHGLLTTIAWCLDGRVKYALDGGIFITGAAVQWLRDGLKIIKDVAETEEMAIRAENTGGVYFVPAFVGMAAPYWDMYARGTIVGITGGTAREHLVRATLESIAYQVYDMLECLKADSKHPIETLRVDGGAVANKFLMQFQADILGIPVEVPRITETTALGVAYLAGLAVGFWESQDELSQIWQVDRVYKPQMTQEKRKRLLKGWKRAVKRSLNWEKK